MEQDTEDEKTEMYRNSSFPDDFNTARIDERTSNVYTQNMRSVNLRIAKLKNPFSKKKGNTRWSRLSEVPEAIDIPEEVSIADYQNLTVPKLILNPRESSISGFRGSECYCCCVRIS